MAIRYRQELINLAGVYFKVEILDTDYVGSVLDFHLKDFEIDWKGQGSERDHFILGSECVVMAQSTDTLDLNTLMNDIREAEEGRFQIAIYKKETSGGTYTLYWLGMVLNDLSGGEDAAPVQHFDIVATDGLGALKGIDYNSNSTTPYGDSTAVTHLLNCLKKIPYNSFFGAADDFLYEIVGLYESAMANTTDSVLNRVQVPGKTFYSKDRNDNYEWKSCYEVLSELCVLFKARLYFEGGVWKFYELYSLENTASVTPFGFQYGGTLVSLVSTDLRTTLTGGFNGGNRVTGQRFEYLPALKEAKQTYVHDSSDNLLDVVINTANGQQQVLSSLPSNGDEKLMLSGSLQVNLVKKAAPYTAAQIYVKVRLLLKHGAYYYVRPVTNAIQNNDYSNANWGTTLGYVEFILVQNVSAQYGGSTVGYGFETLELLSSSALDMNLEIVYVQDLQQNDLSANYTTTATIAGSYLEYIDGDAENKKIYRAYNDVSSFYSSIKAFPDSFTGDRINPMTPNNLKVWDGSAWVESTGTWKRNALNGTSTLLQLTLKEFVAGQTNFIKKRQGRFVGKFSPLLALGVSSEYYLPLGVRFNANDAEFNGEWYKIGEFDDSGVTVDDTPVEISMVIPPSVSATPPVNQTNPTGVVMNDGKIQVEDLAARTTSVELSSSHSYIQSPLGVGTSNKYDSAILHMDSTTRGFLLPRMTESQRDAITSPATGLMIYQTDSSAGVYVYNGSGWDQL